jgi:Cof subfamily protein (haloacid dehalogenase superfamily)
MDIKLIAVDLDGTLLDSEKNISPETVTAIREFLARGGNIVLSSARPPRTTMRYYDELGLSSPMINYNGALVWMPRSSEILIHRPISCNVARTIVYWAREKFPGIHVSGEIRDKWYTDFYDGTYETETSKLCSPDMVAPVDEWLTQSVTKLLLLGWNEWLAVIQKFVRETMTGNVVSVRTDDFLLQVMSKSASKLKALKAVSKMLKIEQEQVMAIGDQSNDVGMLEWAGVGVSMANAVDLCHQVADHVTDHHDENGVANVIRDIAIGGKAPTKQ